jgi:2-hydroxy-3-oxopropionate reductase
MVRRLLYAGFAVRVWNRSREKAAALVSDGAIHCETPADAVRGADVVICMLTNEMVFDELFFAAGLADKIGRGSVVIESSSVLPQASRRHAELLARHGIDYIDAPVSGGVVGATGGTLAIMAGGDPSVVASVHDVLAPLGRATHVGPTGTGQLSKLGNQQIVAVTIGAVAEAMLFIAAGGGSPEAFRDAIRGGFAESRVLDLHGKRMIDRDFVPGGSAGNQLKDLNNVLAVATELSLALPMTQAVQAEFKAFVESDGPDIDHSGILLHLERKNSDAMAAQ